jgi:hypothetical protein
MLDLLKPMGILNKDGSSEPFAPSAVVRVGWESELNIYERARFFRGTRIFQRSSPIVVDYEEYGKCSLAV